METTQYCEVIDRPIENVPVPAYTQEEHGTWALLLAKQQTLTPQFACQEFNEGLRRINFPKDRLPRLRDVSAVIEKHTGWRLLRVDGLVHPKEFFALLARKIFPSTDFIRARSELDYTPAPDMFHDLFGHTPTLTIPAFTEFFEAFGHCAVNARERYPDDHPIQKQIETIYWFTVEFGLINTHQGVRAYGSGSTSSPQELEFCVGPKARRHPFVIDKVAVQPYDIWHLQEDIFVIESFEQLGLDFRSWAARNGILT